ncbi:NUDIX hydrolase domain-like protein [Ustulina deusta]|nr:NUDIX hydrolase domain-like protein [Ustulina deusta]KAI3343254.1 NUDIX hydrolase domain-like protein [Ustulina deusta]
MASIPPVTLTTSTSISASTNASPLLFGSDPSVASFNVSLDAYLQTSPELHGICVGAFVFDDTRRLLLVQRAPHDSYPLRWEVPGGSIDAGDETLLHGLARELWEETGLRAQCTSGLVGKGYTFLTRFPSCVCKYSFVVEVEAYDVKLDPNEHSAFLWVTEDDAKAKKCGDLDIVYTTKHQEDVILEAFEIKRGNPEA